MVSNTHGGCNALKVYAMLIHAASAYLSYVLHIGSDQMISDKGENTYLDIVEGKAWQF